jgi:L-fuconolactonase
MIVETHCHVVAPDQRKYPRHLAEGFLGAWVRELPTEDLLGSLKEAGIDRAVVVQAYGAYAGDNSYVADSVARYPELLAGVFAIDPAEPDAPQRVSYWTRERGLHGVRIMTIAKPELSLDDQRIVPVLERIEELQIPLCVATQFRQLPLVGRLLERFPGVNVALEHMATPDLRGGPPYSAVQPLFDLSRFANCYVKFSTVSIDAARSGKSTCAEFFSRLVDSFGAHRLIWGSNFPATYDRTLKQQLELARDQLSFASSEEQRWIFGEAALSLWPTLR